MKNIIIGGIVTIIVVAGSTVLLNGGSSSKIDALESLSKDYQQLSEDFKNNKTKSDLLASCKNPKEFTKQIQNLENKLDKLQQRRNTINNPTIEAVQEEYIPRPGEQPLDLDGNKIFEGGKDPTPTQQEEYIPRPGEQPLDLDGNKIFEGGKDPTPTQQEEYIPIPGEQPLDLDGNKIFEGGKNPTPTQQEEYIPRPGEQVPDLSDVDYTNILSQINVLEEEILTELNNLKSLCDNQEKEKKEIISNSCVDVCKKYYECAGYTEDSTKEDQQDAYDSCMIECANWSDKGKICANKVKIISPTDCMARSRCTLGEYENILKK